MAERSFSNVGLDAVPHETGHRGRPAVISSMESKKRVRKPGSVHECPGPDSPGKVCDAGSDVGARDVKHELVTHADARCGSARDWPGRVPIFWRSFRMWIVTVRVEDNSDIPRLR